MVLAILYQDDVSLASSQALMLLEGVSLRHGELPCRRVTTGCGLSTSLLITKENVFCTLTGYSGAVTGKRGDLDMFAALRRSKEQQKFKYGIDGGFTTPSVHPVCCKCLHLSWLLGSC